MDRRLLRLEDFTPDKFTTNSTIVCGVLALYVAYQALIYFDVPILSPAEILWNALVFASPAWLLLDAAHRHELQANGMLSQTHAAKSEALRRMLGVRSGALTHKLTGGEGVMRRMSVFANDAPTTDAPPGLGNWDNSCYQNSVLQGLASVGALRRHLERPQTLLQDSGASTSDALHETIAKLNDRGNNGKQLWTPAKLKNMSSWQQQDAQEYFSKILDELDKEADKAISFGKARSGLEGAMQERGHAAEAQRASDGPNVGSIVAMRNPMEGLLAQRVACTRCGFSEGLSMIPFNCLTVPLGSAFGYGLEDCLDEYTKLEEISEVDCAKCTLLRAEQQLRQMLSANEVSDTVVEEGRPTVDAKLLSLPPELRVLASKRLHAIQQALQDDDLSDKTLAETCQIPKKAHVSSTKTRQAVIGRAPQSLVVHVNRSVFDEVTGVQRKNYANVRYPMTLDLQAWMLGSGSDSSATQSMLCGTALDDRCQYHLRAVVTHYGRHENGHYICYRRHPTREARQREGENSVNDEATSYDRWWRLSDEDVSAVTEEDALAQGGVFMLFYERADTPRQPQKSAKSPITAADSSKISLAEAASLPLPSDLDKDLEPVEATVTPQAAAVSQAPGQYPELPRSPPVEDTPSTGTTTEDESEAIDAEELLPARPVPRMPTQPFMRTSRGRQASDNENGFGSAFRAVAAT